MAQDRKSRLETVAPAAASNEPGAGEQQALCQFVTCRIGQEEFALDIWHPNARGHEAMARTLADRLREFSQTR